MDTKEDIKIALSSENNTKYLYFLSLEDFISLCFDLSTYEVDIILNGDWALAQFSTISNLRIQITKRGKKREKFLVEDDFQLISGRATISGQKKKYSFLLFIRDELKHFSLRMIFVFVFSTVFFYVVNSYLNVVLIELLSKLNTTLLTFSSIFFSVYILFTISQTIGRDKNVKLFKNGSIQNFMLIDKYVTRITSIELFINLVLLSIGVLLPEIGLLSPALSIILEYILIIFTSIAVSIMAFLMFVVQDYYFDRAKAINDTICGKEILDEEFLKKNISKKTNN